MKSRTRTISLMLTAAMLLSTLTACGNTAQTTTEATTTTAATTKAESTTADDSGNEAASDTTTEAPKEETAPAEETGEVKTFYNPDFKIELLGDGIKKVTDGEDRELILVPKTLSEVPSEYSESIVIRTPVDNAVFLSSTQVCTFRAVDSEEVINAIGAVCGGADQWATVPAVAERLASGDIIDVTGDGGMGEPDYEKIQELAPDIVFVYTGEYGQFNQIAKFEELGINYAVDNEYLESNYLARMEWMRFVLTFFNADDEIDAVMTKAQENVDAAKAAVENQEKVKIAVFSVYNGSVSATKDTSWLGSMIADMNGENVFGGISEGSVTLEAAYDLIQDADVIIYGSTPLYCNGLEGVEGAFPQITECKAYANNRVYQYSGIFWNGIDQSDIMAGDLAAVMYPDLFADRELSYFVDIKQ